MNKLQNLILILSPLLFAVALPSCPMTDKIKSEMQAEIEPLKAKNAELMKAVQDLNTQLKTVTDEHNTMKQLLTQVSEAVLQQKAAFEQMQNQMKAKSSSARPASNKMTPAPRRR